MLPVSLQAYSLTCLLPSELLDAIEYHQRPDPVGGDAFRVYDKGAVGGMGRSRVVDVGKGRRFSTRGIEGGCLPLSVDKDRVSGGENLSIEEFLVRAGKQCVEKENVGREGFDYRRAYLPDQPPGLLHPLFVVGAAEDERLAGQLYQGQPEILTRPQGIGFGEERNIDIRVRGPFLRVFSSSRMAVSRVETRVTWPNPLPLQQ